MRNTMNKVAVIIISLILVMAVAVGVGGCTCTTIGPPSSLRTIERPPASPSNLRAETMTYNAIKLRWIDNSSNEVGFRIYRDNELIQTVGSNVTTYQETGLKPTTTYQYSVRSYNEAGESASCLTSVRMPNPPITVTLDRIGVYDNREPWIRGVGDVYVGIIVTDGNTTVEKRFPAREGQCYSLDKNETVDIGATIFSTDEVGDYIRIAAIGYEDDGGPGEMLVYQALGAAAEAYLSGGAATLLEMTDFSLGNLLAKLFGAEDDWLGSYENSWGSANDWGIGRYTDITCEDERGIQCLRLWFTIENPLEPGQAKTPTEAPPLGGFPMTDSFNLAGKRTYDSKVFPLQANQNLSIILRAGCPIYKTAQHLDGLLVIIGRTDPPGAVYQFDLRWIKSYELHRIGNQWEANISFRPDDTGLYQLSVINLTDEPTWCEYAMSLR